MNLFQWHLRSTEVERRLDELENTVNDPEKDIDDATKKINELFLFTLGARSKATKPRHRKNKPNKWYDKTSRHSGVETTIRSTMTVAHILGVRDMAKLFKRTVCDAAFC